MERSRSTLGLSILILFALILFAASVYEARQQRDSVGRALSTQATLLAHSLGPGLVAAANAARELDEIVVWKLLDNARLLARLSEEERGTPEIAAIAEANGLDSVVYFDASGQFVDAHGELPPQYIVESIDEILQGSADELILGSSLEDEVEHLGVAVATLDGGAVLVRTHASTARTFARRLGVENLLTDLVGTQGLLYLGYHEDPTGWSIEASWNDQPLPAAIVDSPGLVEVDGRPVYAVEVQLESPAGSAAHLLVGLDGEPLERAAAAAMRRILIMAVVLTALAISGVAAALISRGRSLERERAAKMLSEAETAGRRSERLAAAGALTAGLAHEVRSPMNAIGLAAQRLERKLTSPVEREIALRIREEIQRLEGTLREFLELASPVTDPRETTDLATIAREVVALLAEEARARGLVVSPVEGAAPALVDRESIRRSLINLVRNAIQASNPGGTVSVRAWTEGNRALIAIADRGRGIDPEISGRLFDPFVSGRASGVGLGLALVKRVAEEHDGSVELRSRTHGGAVATLELPAAIEVTS